MANCVNVTSSGALIRQRHLIRERMIRSVRRALLALSNEREMNEDQLRTFLSEAESIVNSRPLTPVTLEVDSGLPLTPEHFLKLSASSGLPPVTVGNGDSQPRRSWRFVQHVSDQFWRRFSKEYLLPSCNGRSVIDSRGTSRPMTSFLS